MIRLLLVRHPDQLAAKRPLIIDEFLELVSHGRVDAVSTMIEMLGDLHRHGRDSRFLRHLKGTPISELKSQSRGGPKGGSRVYLFFTADDNAGVVNCEVKDADTASVPKLKVVLQVIKAYRNGVDVFARPEG